MMLPIQITSDNEPGMEIAEVLLDSGASGKFIDKDYARDIHVEKKDLCKPITVYNVDGTPNKQGTIMASPNMSSFISQSTNENGNNDFLSAD